MTRVEFQHIVTPIQDKMYRFALRMVKSIPEAEDVVQEVLIKLWQQRDRLSQISNIEAWSIRLIRNQSIDKLRRKKYTDEIDSVLHFSSNTPSPVETVEQQDTFRLVGDIMNALPEKQRLVMHLRDIEEYSYQEIAAALDMPLNQVKVNLFRARKYVRKQLMNTKDFSGSQK